MKIIEHQIVEEGIFVWGSNEIGRSFSGAAVFAVEKCNALIGVSFGFTGNSFAIPTKDALIRPLSLEFITRYINEFIKQANKFRDTNFWISKIGCGLAGFTNEEIAPLFENANSNCYFDLAWKPYLGGVAADLKPRKYWGSFNDET